jgi:hypothetical protein
VKGYPKTLAALREQEDRSWAVADALVAEIKTHESGRVLNGEFDRCAAYLAANGYEVGTDYLRQMHRTALKFRVSETRKWQLPFRLYMEAAKFSSWTPGFMEDAELNHWTLRQFSEQLTGKRWADTDTEAAKRVLADPEKAAQVLAEVPVEQRGEMLRELAVDPEVANAAFDRTDHQARGTTQTALANVSRAHHQGEMRRMAERQAAMSPAARETNDKINQVGAKLDLDTETLNYKVAARKFVEAIPKALPLAGPYKGGTGPLSFGELVAEAIEQHQLAGRTLEILSEYVSSGQAGSSLDDELAKILGGGA